MVAAALLTSAGLYAGVEVVAEPSASGDSATEAERERLVPAGARSSSAPVSEVASQVAVAGDPAPSGATSHDSVLARHVEAVRRARETVLPTGSGSGRRVVFSMSRQRVWIVRAGDRVGRTYPVSGSVYDNLSPGSYSVFSRSEHARGIDDSGTMRWFVRFTHGPNAAIGFHDIPVAGGKRVQTRAELGTPLSHGCIRQAAPDAKAMWRFARVGTRVVVTQ